MHADDEWCVLLSFRRLASGEVESLDLALFGPVDVD